MSAYQSIILLSTVIAYLFGSISSAILVCQIMGLPDPRTEGSKNPGATNVLRIGGKKAALLTLFGDMLKGALPVLAGSYFGIEPLGLALIMFAAFLGHLFPIFFSFTGGKGVATLLGCLLALSWPVGFSWLGCWLMIALLFRYSSLASLGASLLAPILTWYFTHELVYVITLSLMAIILLIRHKTNIVKLLSGKESKIGRKKS